MDKGKSVAVPEFPRPIEGVDETVVAEATKQFVSRKLRRTGQSSAASDDFSLEVSTLLKGLNPRFHLEALAAAHIKGCNKDFAHLRIDPSRAFNLVPNVMNSKSVLLDKSNVGSCLLESLVLPRDRHAMYHTKIRRRSLPRSSARVSRW